jgi:hypothetical protein
VVPPDYGVRNFGKEKLRDQPTGAYVRNSCRQAGHWEGCLRLEITLWKKESRF